MRATRNFSSTFMAACVAVAMAFSAQSMAATIHVPADQPTIQAGIDAAVSGADEVVVAPGTYNEIIDFNGKAITVRSSGGAAITIIDAGPVVAPAAGKPVVRCDSGEGPDTVLDGFTVTGGTGDRAWGLSMGIPITLGGGMFNSGSNPTITRCNFTANTAGGGGGVANVNANPDLSECLFMANNATEPVESFGGGGGMLNSLSSSAAVSYCMFRNNSAGYGGGMHNAASYTTVSHCLFSENTADGYGGGIWNGGGLPKVEDSTFLGNIAAIGGGIASGGGSPTVSNCVFSGNMASLNGGGVDNKGAWATITNCTFYGNTAGNHGGGMYTSNLNPSITVVNSIFRENLDGGGENESAQIYVQSGVTTVNHSDIQGGWTGPGSNNIDADPLFVDADGADDVAGTEDDDLRLMSGSPCIGTGDNSVVTEATDLDGNPRIVNCVVDMGAYEFQEGSDTDGDTVPDGCDVCAGFDDTLDADGDSVPDGCDLCPDTAPGVAVDGDGCPLPVIAAAVSRAVHGDQGPFDIDLLGPVTAIEMRLCDKQTVVMFDQPVEACDAALDTEVAVNVGSVSGLTLVGNELTIDLIDVPDPACLQVDIGGLCAVGRTTPMTPATLSLIILGGDTNESGGVTVSDLATVKANNSELTDATNFKTDVNCSGGITIGDLSAVKDHLTNAAPGLCP